MLVEGNFLKGHNFDQVLLLAITYERNKNLIVFSYVIVTFETDDKLVWFRHQLEQDFHSLVSLLLTTPRGLLFISSKVILELLDACFHYA